MTVECSETGPRLPGLAVAWIHLNRLLVGRAGFLSSPHFLKRLPQIKVRQREIGPETHGLLRIGECLLQMSFVPLQHAEVHVNEGVSWS